MPEKVTLHFHTCFHSEFEQDTETSPGYTIPLCCLVFFFKFCFFLLFFLLLVLGFGGVFEGLLFGVFCVFFFVVVSFGFFGEGVLLGFLCVCLFVYLFWGKGWGFLVLFFYFSLVQPFVPIYNTP